jgi:hypothetical protein
MKMWISQAVCALILLCSTPTSAALIEQDLFTPGDALLTLDDATGLRWLDLSTTVGLSFDDILANVGGWSSMGFRHGTAAEVCALFAGNAIAPAECPQPDGLQINDGGAAADSFHQFLGLTTEDPTSQSWGFFDDQTATIPVGRALLSNNGQSVVFIEADVASSTDTSPIVGNYLVLVPEPSTGLARIIREARRENVKSAEDPRTSDRRPAQTYYQYVEQAEGRRPWRFGVLGVRSRALTNNAG